MHTREELIALCEKGIVHKDKWADRDSDAAQRQLGECWALLKAGCDFRFMNLDDDYCCSDDLIIWIMTTVPGWEDGIPYHRFYFIPTEKSIEKGKDWT